MKRWLTQFAQWRAGVARQLNENEAWREVVNLCRALCAPVYWVAGATLRTLPGLRKLEWLLEIDSLTRRHPVVLAFSLAIVLLRGLMTTPLGHIGTDKLIYPLLGALSGYNPFLGVLCAIVFGVGDLTQKFFWPDMYGAAGWADLNYWGAMVGYVVAYSSIVMMGLFPGVASRACRAAVVSIVKSVFARRATRMADGAVPLMEPVSPIAEMVAAALGGVAAGWVVMHEIAPITEQPAFLWRPNPDVSCHQLEVDTHLKGYATAGGTGAALGGAASVVLPPPPLDGVGAPQLPDEFEWTAPNGVTYVVRKNEHGEYINILTGGLVDVSNLEAWKRSWGNIIEEQRQWGDEQMEKLQNRDTWFDREMDKLVAAQKEREKMLENLAKMEKNIFFGDGPESKLYKPPGEPGNILDHIRNLQRDLYDGKKLDRDKYDKIYKTYKNQKQGKILAPSQIPTENELIRDIFNETFENTLKEFVTGQKSDGSTSWLGIAGRGLTAVVTAGGSEFVLVPANALNTMKNYVDRGGNSALEAYKEAIETAIRDEIIGRIVGKGFKGAGAAGKYVAGAGAEIVEQAAKNGNSAAKALIKVAQGFGNAGSKIGKTLTRPVGGKAPNLGNVAKAGKVVTPDGRQWVRNVNRAGSTNVRTVKAGIPASEVPSGFPPKAVKQIKMVSDKYGVIIDARPTNPHSGALIQSGKAVPKPQFIKTKTLSPLDKMLGAKGKPGTAGFYKPKLPPQGNMSDEAYDSLKKLYNQRAKEFVDELPNLKELRKQGKVYVKDGMVHQGTPPNGKPYAGDIDIFDIRDPVTGRPLPRYQVDHKGNILYDSKTGQPKLNPVREEIIKELKNGPCQAQHGSHMDWKYDNLEPNQPVHSSTQAAKEFQHSQKIDNGVLDKHRPGGEPLISFGPDGQTDTSFIQGGR